MKRTEIVALSVLAISILFNILSFPKSPGNFYTPSHYYNLFLPNFGLGSDFSLLPTAFKTLLTQYYLFKIFLELFQDNIITLHRSFYLFSQLLTFLAFILFFSIVADFKRNRVLLSSLICLMISWSPISLLLGMSTLFCLTKSTSQKRISFVICWILLFITLSLYWHSAHMVFLFPILCFLFLKLFFQILCDGCNLIEVEPKVSPNTLLVFLVISIFIWVYVRESSILSQVFKSTYFLDPSTIYHGIFDKGSFIPSDYQYEFKFYIPLRILDLLRYFVFLLTFVMITFYSLYSLWIKNYDLKLIWALSLLFGSIAFLLSYYIASGTLAPATILIFLIPYLLGLCMIGIKDNPRVVKMICLISFTSIIISLFLSQSAIVYKDITTSAEFSEEFDIYYPSSIWVATYLGENELFSDANTIGYVAIWYGYARKYYIHPIHFYSVGLSTYDALYKGVYGHNINFIYNFNAYEKNLVFESLQSWNKFKSLSPNILKNHLSLLYNDGYIWVLSR